MRVAIAGGGVAGLMAALLLSRGGHDVDLFEADPSAPPDPAADAFLKWERRGVAQHRLPHQFLGRLREVLRARAPDVLARVLAAGATEHPVYRKIPGGEWLPDDEALTSIFVRRPVFEAVLRGVVAESSVRLHAGVHVDGLLVNDGSARGLRVLAGDCEADLVVDATGRRTAVATWLTEHGLPVPVEERSLCERVYYCRYYRLRDGAEYLDSPSPSGAPLGDIGAIRFNTMRGDNRTFTILVGAPSWDHDYRALREPAAFQAVLGLIPPLAPYISEDFATPITDILAMGGLENVRRHYMGDAVPVLRGLVGIGDSYCHTDPLFGWGASLAAAHAAALADAADTGDVNAALESVIGPTADAAFVGATLEDDARDREARGEVITPDPEREKGAFVRKVVAPASMLDPVIFRAMMRRVMVLDPADAIYQDHDIRARALGLVEKLKAMPRPYPVPTSEDFATAMRGASVPTA
jgi:2-polyprenyl-6-methoxyphenol hydroxylase-like FAD-dependent oxidoreductase